MSNWNRRCKCRKTKMKLYKRKKKKCLNYLQTIAKSTNWLIKISVAVTWHIHCHGHFHKRITYNIEVDFNFNQFQQQFQFHCCCCCRRAPAQYLLYLSSSELKNHFIKSIDFYLQYIKKKMWNWQWNKWENIIYQLVAPF